MADTLNHRIQIFNKDVTYKAKIPDANNGAGLGHCNFDTPFGIAVDESSCGHIYIADSQNKRVQIYTKKWLHVRSIGNRGEMNGVEGNIGLVGGTAIDTNGVTG